MTKTRKSYGVFDFRVYGTVRGDFGVDLRDLLDLAFALDHHVVALLRCGGDVHRPLGLPSTHVVSVLSATNKCR